MLNKPDFLALMASGDLFACWKQCMRYGNIHVDSQFDIEDGAQAGAHRITTIEHHGEHIMFHLHNGDVVDALREMV